jgi:hypothetical protein
VSQRVNTTRQPITRNDGTWRIKTNEELEILIKKETIVRFVKSQRLRWAAHVIRMDTIRTVKKLLNGNHVHHDQ